MKKRIFIIATVLLAILISAPLRADEGTVSADTLNLRSDPAITDGNVVVKMQKDDIVTILDEKDEWLKVQTAGGQVGWVAAVYIDRGGEQDQDKVLKTAQYVFNHSFATNKTTTIDGIVEEYKEYDAGKVMEAYNLVTDTIEDKDFKNRDVALLLRGKCMVVIGWYGGQYNKKFFKSHKKEFSYNEVGNNFIYNGADFKTLLKEYPKSGMADDAKFEISNLPHAGECEGQLDCYLQGELAAFEPFFKEFPDSPLMQRAIEIVNAAGLNSIINLAEGSGSAANYDREAVIKLINRYRSIIEKSGTPYGAFALHPIADAYAVFDMNDSAIAVFKKIIKDFPQYDQLEHVKQSLKGLKK